MGVSAWTRQEWSAAKAMLDEGKSYREIAEITGRSVLQIRSKRHYESLSVEQVEQMNLRTTVRRRAIREGRPRRQTKVTVTVLFEKVPPFLLEERARRQSITPRDITAEFFGDPLPGYSALDRRA